MGGQEKDGSMKLTTLGIALITCIPLFPQNQPPSSAGQSVYTAFRTATGVRLTGTLLNEQFSLTAIKVDRLQDSVRLTGDVEVILKGIKLQADDVVIHFDTGEIEPSGNVRLKPIPQ
jgi:lipopolysaccharide assembly outer membrane protein LptD (OstA)